MTAADLARTAGVHVNTARLHLDGLVEDGLAIRVSEPRTKPGRPRILYTVSEAASGQRSFRLLAEILTGLVSSLDDGAAQALETGRVWGRHLIERVPPYRHIDGVEAVNRIKAMLDHLGFQPGPPAVDGELALRVHNCAFREIAGEHAEIVCNIHLGMVMGGLEELRAPVRMASLEPFETANSCLARMRQSKAELLDPQNAEPPQLRFHEPAE